MPGRIQVLTSFFAAAQLLSAGCSTGDKTASPGGPKEGPPENIEVIEEFWPGGMLRLRREVLRSPEGTEVDHGKYTRWHTNGQKEYEATFVHGKKHGTATFWHENGRKWIEENYADGRKHGVRRIWDDTGKRRKEENFANGKPHGTWTTWRDNGEIGWQQSFNHGVPQP
jgi:hypothetical protein